VRGKDAVDVAQYLAHHVRAGEMSAMVRCRLTR
jgi:hypothetical protein